MEESSCARDVAMVIACCFARPCVEPPHAQTSADAAITNVVRRPARRNCRFTPSLCRWRLNVPRIGSLKPRRYQRVGNRDPRAPPNNGKLLDPVRKGTRSTHDWDRSDLGRRATFRTWIDAKLHPRDIRA